MPDVPLSSLPIEITVPPGASVVICQSSSSGVTPTFGRVLPSALLLTTDILAAAIGSLLVGLPTTLPTIPGVLWLNGGVVQVS